MKIGLIYDERIPYSGIRPTENEIAKFTEYADIINLDNFEVLLQNEYDCIVNLHGCCFIKPAWKHIVRHLNSGRGLVNIGSGTPFSVPVSISDGCISVERVQTAYHEKLNICHGLAVSSERYDRLAVNSDLSLLKGFEDCFLISDTIGMIVQFTKFKDVPVDNGSSGPMDAVMYPLLTGYGENDRAMAAPVVMIENTKGEYEGGRWIFVNQAPEENFWQGNGTLLVKTLACYTANKVYEIIIRPNYASYYPGERPTLLLQAQNLTGGSRKAGIQIQISKDEAVVYDEKLNIDISDEIMYQSIVTNFNVNKGIYEITAVVEVEGEPARTHRNGFWGYDRELLESGCEITCGKDYFYKDGKPMPVVGMTYMQSDVHRKYLYLPNVHVWDKDMEEMKRAGINMIRTGVWTAVRTFAFNDGIVSEEVLRGIDAMFLTAKKYDIPIVFNFFAFTPEVWEGINPYLDPRSINAQKRYISSIVSRHAKSRGVSWDLINEPSICTIRTNWRPAPNRDKYEVTEWNKWLMERHGTIETLQERWNCTPEEVPSFDSIMLPEDEDFNSSITFTERHKALKVHDYILFTQHVMNKWAYAMVKAIRASGSVQPVTIGQDEGLNAKRPSPFFYQESVDYTTCHSWWLNDDLYWDGLFSKAPNKPSLIQETGIMYVQNADGRARRTESELRNILERKYALAFAANNAGAIHWIWNINTYMDSINEVNIGAVRADGSQKLEADVSYDFGDFIRCASDLFEDRKEEEVAVIFPYANSFSIRDYATAASKRAARVLGYDLKVPFKAYGEYHLEDLKADKLIILPSPRTLTQKAWDTLMDRVDNGSVLLITGPISYDEYFNRVPDRSGQLGICTELGAAAREETLHVGEKGYRVAFGGNKLEWVDKEVETTSGPAALKTITYGKGKVLWSPLPLEVNEDDAVIGAVYTSALKEADLGADFEWLEGNVTGILGKKLQFRHGSVYIFVSECGFDVYIDIKDNLLNTEYKFNLPSGRAMLFAVDKKGQIIKTYRNAAVDVLV